MSQEEGGAPDRLARLLVFGREIVGTKKAAHELASMMCTALLLRGLGDTG
jgi:hypothetical protein